MSTTIRHYYVRISDRMGIIKDPDLFKVNELNVVAENDINMVVNDTNFTTICKESRTYSACLDKPSIGLDNGDRVWGSRIVYSLYTKKTKRAATIRKEIEQAILKKYGFFLSGVNLSIIEDDQAGG